MAILAFTTLFVATSSDWGRDRVRGMIESTVGTRLVAGAKFRIGSLSRSGGTTWVADSVSLVGADGRHVASIRRASIGIALPSVFRGDVRLGLLVLDGVRLSVEQGRDGTWNVQRLFATRTGLPPEPGPRRRVLADSIEVRDSRVEVSMPDSLPILPSQRRTFDKLFIAAGRTTLVDGDGAGHLPFRQLAVVVNDPPVRVTGASGDVRWWSDSLRLHVPRLRLPASRASVTGRITWHQQTDVALDVAADSVSASDVRWISALIPSEGAITAKISVRSAGPALLRYEIAEFDLKAFQSHLTGRFDVTPGQVTEVRGLRVAMQPLDLALVRNVFGDTILKAAWQGAIHGTLTGGGGSLDSLVIDSVAARYTDARIGGAQSRFSVSGAMDVATATTRLIAMQVRLDSLDIRTVGAVVRTADSLRGAITGSLVLDGPTEDVRFSALRLRHVNGDAIASVVRGSGRVASDVRGHWMDATLTLDTLAIATLAPDSIALPVRGIIGGTLVLGATADTMRIDARLRAGDAETHLTGTTLLDSLRTQLELRGTIAGLDLRNFIARKDIPAHRLGGSLRVSLDQGPRQADRHLELRLDTTSRIGSSAVTHATLRFGQDSSGIHLDTADVRTPNWRAEARGRLAATGRSSTDSITFATEIDSLGAIRMLLLDTAGVPLVDSLAGRLNARQGVLKGSFEHATLTTDLGASGVVFGATRIHEAIGQVQVDNLPDSASGYFRGTLRGIASGNLALDEAQVRADVSGGQRARVAGRVTQGDSVDLRFGADVTWPDSSFTVRLDSLEGRFRDHRWLLALPATARVNKTVVAVDSLVLRSDHNAYVVAAGRVPERGEMSATIDVRRLGVDELSFLGILPTDLSGLITARTQLTGSRDAPAISATAVLDSIRADDRDRPSLRFEGTYANKKANVALTMTAGGRRVLDARGDIPVDLTLREVADRLIDAPMSMQLRSDSVDLSAFAGLLPRVTDLGGSLSADVNVGGTLERPRGTGSLTITNGAFALPRFGVTAREANADIRLAGDSVIVRHLRLSDGESPTDTVGLSGIVHLSGRKWTEWGVAMQSTARNFRVIDDPRLGTAEASWALDVDGRLRSPRVTGNVEIPYAVYTIGPQRRQRVQVFTDSLAQLEATAGVPNVDGVIVTLGSDVRLKSRDANVQLTGNVELFGALTDPWLSGAVTAERGTYQVKVGPIRRTFRVDSGSVVLEGTKDVPAALNIHASYLVRRSDEDDVTVRAHIYGMTDRPRLDLTSDLGTATSQSEIISYLVFGRSSFGLDSATAGSRGEGALTTATAAFLPTLGGMIEATLGTILPFFSTFQVTSTVSNESFSAVTRNPLDGLLNSYALTGGRQIGSDSFLSLSTGRCSASNVSGAGSAQFWFGAVADYRPKRTIGASLSIDPGPAPCNRVAAEGSNYQIGLDLSYDWKFGRPRR
jgi:translocation and assembly module TamB